MFSLPCGRECTMNKAGKARVVTTDAVIDSAIARAKEYEPYRPVVTAAAYSPSRDAVSLRFRTGVELLIPRKLLQGLESANRLSCGESKSLFMDRRFAGRVWTSITTCRA